MNLPPTSLIGRLCVAAVAALAVIAAAAVWLAPRSALPQPAELHGADDPASWPRLPPGLRPVGQVWLFGPGQQPPPAVAPIVQVLPSGVAALRRAPPVGLVPAAATGPAALLLPAADVSDLSAAQRAALLDLLGALIQERPVSARSVSLHGIGASEAGLGRLLAWVR